MAEQPNKKIKLP